MIISPPFLPEKGSIASDPTRVDSMMDAVDKLELSHGLFPIASDRRWHTGVHLSPDTLNERVRAIADGEVVAYRVCQEAIEGSPGSADSSAGFVLLKHKTETGEGRTLTFYSLYMHLLEFERYNDYGTLLSILPPFLRGVSPGPNTNPSTAPPVQAGNGQKVYRKDVLGLTGKNHGARHLHFEIFMTQPDFDAYFGATQLGKTHLATPIKADCWGSTHFVLSGGQSFLSVPRNQAMDRENNLRGIAFPGHNEGTLAAGHKLYVESYFHLGRRYTRSWLDSGDGHPKLITPEPIADSTKDYEYEMYKRATALYPACPSDGYEMLRFGRILNAHPTLTDTVSRTTWLSVVFDEAGSKGYINVADEAIQKISDADFPFFTGWKKVSEEKGPFDSDGICDIDAMKALLNRAEESVPTPPRLKAAGETSGIFDKEDELIEYVKRNKDVRAQLRGLVCEAPSEWDSANHETRYARLKQPGEFYENNPRGYADFMRLLSQYQFWGGTTFAPGEKMWYFHPLEFIRHFRKCGWLTNNELRRTFPPTALRRVSQSQWVSEPVNPANSTIDSYGVDLNRAMIKFGVTTPLRQAAFLGNAMQETQWFSLLEEGNASTQRYAPWNGRGFLQLTWPDNYIQYWRFLGRQVERPLADRLHGAARTANQVRSNAALMAAEAHVPASMKEWRVAVRDDPVDAASSAGAYWAWSKAALPADTPPVMRRQTARVGNTVKPYYSCQSYGLVAATVNVGHPSTAFSSIYGLQARFQAYASALVVLADITKFPTANGTSQFAPEW